MCFSAGRGQLTCASSQDRSYCARLSLSCSRPEPACIALKHGRRVSSIRGMFQCSKQRSAGPQFRHHLHRLVCLAEPPSTSTSTNDKARLAVFVSGGGSNMKAIHAACREGQVKGEIVVVISNSPTCGGILYAEANKIPTLTYPIPKKTGGPGLTDEQLVEALTKEYGVDYVILAGFLKLIPAALVRAYHRAMLNIHPGLLPSFGGKGLYGERVHRAVVTSGARFSGPTVHFVDEEYDTGPILAQAVVPVYPTDSPTQLAARVLVQEHKLYPRAIAALCDGRVTWREDGIPIMWEAH